MSQVRWCDRCGNVFPTTQEGWVGGQVAKTIRKDGALVSVAEPVDYCAACANPRTDHDAIIAELTTSPNADSATR